MALMNSWVKKTVAFILLSAFFTSFLINPAFAADDNSFDYCSQVPGSITDTSTPRGQCAECLESHGGAGKAVYTAVGCIRVDNQGLTTDIIRVFMGMAGGIALFSLLSAAISFTTSQGDTNKVKHAKELITAAVTGLFFIVFSIFILQFIGVSILKIPGLG